MLPFLIVTIYLVGYVIAAIHTGAFMLKEVMTGINGSNESADIVDYCIAVFVAMATAVVWPLELIVLLIAQYVKGKVGNSGQN